MEINIDAEFRSLIPKISEDELIRLEKSLIEEGCRDPLVLWDGILLDGHNRYEICICKEIPFKTIGKTFDNRDQAKIWIIANQLARRNITPEQRKYLIGMQYKMEKKGQGKHGPERDQNEPFEKTAEKIAAQHHVGQATVKRAEKFAEAVEKLPTEERREVLSGKSGKTNKQIIESVQSERPKKSKVKIGPPCMGMQYARLAILDLEKILPKDSERTQAFSCVKEWIYEHEV